MGQAKIITSNDTLYDKATLAKYAKDGKYPKYVVKTTNKVPYNIKKTTLAKPIEEESLLSKALDKVDDVMSAPQRAAVYALTGKYENPSAALGIKNKWGAMAADMILDPMNLLGVSAISKGVSRIGGKVLNKIAGTTAEHLDEFAKLADKAPLDLHNPKIKTKSVYQSEVAEDLKDMLKDAKNTYKDSYKSIYGNSRFNYPKEFWDKYDNVLKNVYKDIPIEQARNKFLELSKTGVGTALINDLINQSKDKNGNIVNNETKYATSESFKPVFDTPKPKVKFNKTLTTLPIKQEVTKQVEKPKIETKQEYTKTPTKQDIDYTFNGEYIPSDTPNVPNVKTLKDRKTNKPMFFINQAGDKIPYDRELKGITKEFQYKQFGYGGKLDNPDVDVVTIAKGLKHGQTMGEFNSLNKIDRQRTIDAFNLLHAKSNFTFDDIDFKSAKTESDSTNAISDYFNGRILGENSNSLEGQGIMNTKQSKNFTKGFLSTLPKRKLGGKLPKYDNGNNFQWNSAGATPTAPQTQTYSIAPATSSFAPITAKDTMNTSMTKSDYSSYLKDNSDQLAIAAAYGLTNAAGAYQTTKGNSSDKAAAGINAAVDVGATVLTPWYAYAKAAAGMGEDMVDKTTISDADGGNVRQVGKSKGNTAADNLLDPIHETMIKDATKGDWGSVGLNAITGGAYGIARGYKKDRKDLKEYEERIAAEEAAAAEAKRIAEEKFRLEQQTNYSKGYNMVNPITGRENAGIYKYGGGLPKLVTGGNLIPVSSDTQKVVGASHEQGGVPIANKAGQPVAEVEGGESITDEKVFTDRVEVSPGITFAMMNEALGKKKGKFETKLASSDFREKNTAKREIQKIDSDINQLFELQGQKVQALGLDNGNTQDMPKASFGADLGKYASLLQYPYNAIIIAKTPKIPKPVDDVNYNQVTMPMKTDYNINSALLNNESNFRKLNKNLDENTSNSATARGNKLAAFSKVLSSNNDLYTLKENTQTDLINKSNMNSQSVINNNIVNKQDIDNANIAKINNYNVANMQRDSDINKMKTDNFASLTKNIGDISNYDQEKKVDFQQKMTILVNQSNAEEITRLTGTSVMSDILNADKRNYDVVISKLKTLNDGGVALANFVKAHPR